MLYRPSHGWMNSSREWLTPHCHGFITFGPDIMCHLALLVDFAGIDACLDTNLEAPLFLPKATRLSRYAHHSFTGDIRKDPDTKYGRPIFRKHPEDRRCGPCSRALKFYAVQMWGPVYAISFMLYLFQTFSSIFQPFAIVFSCRWSHWFLICLSRASLRASTDK